MGTSMLGHITRFIDPGRLGQLSRNQHSRARGRVVPPPPNIPNGEEVCYSYVTSMLLFFAIGQQCHKVGITISTVLFDTAQEALWTGANWQRHFCCGIETTATAFTPEQDPLQGLNVRCPATI